MPRLEGFTELERKLAALHKEAKANNVDVIVGYTQSYAVYVHEDLNAMHPVGKAKFLEDPARRLQTTLASLVESVYRATKNLKQALFFAGLRLQRESQEEVPIDTGALKASAFTKVVKGDRA